MRVLLAALLTLFTALPAHAGATYSGVYFFGDSLTDTGNVTTVYATVPHAPGAPATIPGSPYYQDRASNGPLYADALAAGLGFNAMASFEGGNNFAFGGARTRYQLFGPPFLGINDQVARYVARPGPADPYALYVVWAGANNLQDILVGRTTDVLGNPVPGIAATLGDINGMLSALYSEGARNLLVPNVPNLGRVPRIGDLGAAAKAAGTALSQAFDNGLTTMLDGFVLSHPGVNLIRFNSYNALEDIVANASSIGLTNLTGRCYTGDDLGFTGGGTVCPNPDQYLFWDGIHPTAIVHGILGRQMLAAAVPEPGTWALLALGLVVLGTQARRTRRPASLSAA